MLPTDQTKQLQATSGPQAQSAGRTVQVPHLQGLGGGVVGVCQPDWRSGLGTAVGGNTLLLWWRVQRENQGVFLMEASMAFREPQRITKDEITQVAQEGKGFISPFPGQRARSSGGVRCSHIQREEKAAVKPTWLPSLILIYTALCSQNPSFLLQGGHRAQNADLGGWEWLSFTLGLYSQGLGWQPRASVIVPSTSSIHSTLCFCVISILYSLGLHYQILWKILWKFFLEFHWFHVGRIDLIMIFLNLFRSFSLSVLHKVLVGLFIDLCLDSRLVFIVKVTFC